MSQRELLVDLDGVLVNFVYGALKVHDRLDIPYEEIDWNFFERVTPGDAAKFWAPLGFEFWKNLPWIDNGRVLIAKLMNEFGVDNIALCTSPCDTLGSVEGKIAWIQREIPALRRNFMICPHKKFASGPNRILIDDNDGNCEKFVAGGGRAILVPQPWNKRAGQHIPGVGYSVDKILAEVRSL